MLALGSFKKQFETYLEKQRFDRDPVSLYDPFYYILGLGGKRIRPVLLLASNNLFGGNLSEALPAAMAIELFHNFSLIHDDIMDEADIRRGQPTVHKKFSTNTAILSGDAMFVSAYEYLNKLERLDLFSMFNNTAKEVCEGQQMDIEFEKRFDVTPDEYIQMITLKTAVLLGCSLQMGAAIAGASLEQQTLIYNFGKNLGISFQIKDDILDTYANQNDLGKQIGGDIIQNKRTYLMLHSLTNASTQDKKAYLNMLKDSSMNEVKKIKNVKEIFDRTNTKVATEREASRYYNLSLSYLDQLESQSINLSIFREFAQQLLNRKL